MTSHSRLIAAGALTSERVGQFHRYWQGKCDNGSPPRRAAIDPAESPRLLPNIVVPELKPEPFRVRYRLVGTRVADPTVPTTPTATSTRAASRWSRC